MSESSPESSFGAYCRHAAKLLAGFGQGGSSTGGAGPPMIAFSLTTLTAVATITGFGQVTGWDTAVDGDGMLANGLLVTSAKARQSSKDEIVVGTMFMNRINDASEWSGC